MAVKWDRKRLHNPHSWAKETGSPIAWPGFGSGSYSYGTVRVLTGPDAGQERHDEWSLLAPGWTGGTPDHVLKARLHAIPRSIPFASWDDLVAWAAEHLGTSGWDCLVGENDWTPVPGSTASPCMETVRRGDARMASYGTCGKPVKENGLCGQHLAVARRRAEADDARRAHREKGDANDRIAADAIEALAAFTPEGKDAPGVPASGYWLPYRGETSPGGPTGEVTVHAEDLLAILREVGWRREAMGDVA